MESLKHLENLFTLLQSLNIPEPPELAQAREVIKELMAVSETYATAMADIQRKVEALQAIQCPAPNLPAPDPAVAKAVEAAQQRITEALQTKWTDKYDWEKAAIN